MASNWNSAGEVNGYMSRFWGLFLLPIVTVASFLLFTFLPKLDPRKKNYKKFEKYYDGFILIFTIYMLYIHLLTLLWNLGYTLDIGQMIVPAISILFICIGRLMMNVKSNWFIGIRTPWTLSDDKVWEKTHQLGGKLFQISGLISLLSIFWTEQAVWFLMIPVMSSSIFLFIYSYFEYKKLNK